MRMLAGRKPKARQQVTPPMADERHDFSAEEQTQAWQSKFLEEFQGNGQAVDEGTYSKILADGRAAATAVQHANTGEKALPQTGGLDQ